VLPALRDSYERLFHDMDEMAFWIALADAPSNAVELLRTPRLEWAIGVICRRSLRC
jgi:hypothetical protein